VTDVVLLKFDADAGSADSQDRISRRVGSSRNPVLDLFDLFPPIFLKFGQNIFSEDRGPLQC
jgi:hypothetical protein